MKNLKNCLIMIFSFTLSITFINFAFSNTTINENLDLITKEFEKYGKSSFFFTTYGKDPYIKILHPQKGEIEVKKCGCYDIETGNSRHLKKSQDLENLAILRDTINVYDANIRIDKRYKGDLESKFGNKILDKLHSVAPDGITVFIENYEKEIPMSWIFNNSKELKALNKGLMTKFVTQQIVPKKVPLIIEVLDNSTIDSEDLKFLQKYFTIFPITNQIAKEFFEKNSKMIIDFTYNMVSSGNTSYKKETITDGLLRQFEGFYKDFKTKDLIIYCAGTLITKMLWDSIYGTLKSATTKTKDTIFNFNKEKENPILKELEKQTEIFKEFIKSQTNKQENITQNIAVEEAEKEQEEDPTVISVEN